MPSQPPAIELLPATTGARSFGDEAVVRLGDVDRSGRLRLDASARMLQDVATDDADDVGLDRRFGWLVRRTKIVTSTPASLGETLAVSTWCTGLGRSWAERRSALLGERGARIDAVSLWVQVAIATGRPTRLADDFLGAYAESAAGRSVTARLSLPGPPDGASPTIPPTWVVRRCDLDPYGHVNNAATWSFLEEVAVLDGQARVGTAELEYLAPVEHGSCDVIVDRGAADSGAVDAWLVTAGSVLAAARWTPGVSAG